MLMQPYNDCRHIRKIVPYMYMRFHSLHTDVIDHPHRNLNGSFDTYQTQYIDS